MIYAALQSDTLSWQRSLKFAGFYRGRLDGLTGPLTREAAAQWRESHQQLQIRYGRLDATDEDCIRAAKIANAHYFISHLPQGYNTMLYSDGANLSQGQRQLVAIARADALTVSPGPYAELRSEDRILFVGDQEAREAVARFFSKTETT